MKYRPSASFIICLVPILAVGGVAGWVWSKANSVPEYKRVNLGFFEALSFQEKKRRGIGAPTPEQLAASRQQVIELKQKMLTEFPDLAVEEKPVPDDQNGFRLLYELADDNGNGQPKIPVTAELRSLLKSDAPWDAPAMRTALEANGEFISRIEHIAALPQRSSANMPEGFVGFFHARPVKLGSDILLAKARLAAEAKDEAEALRLVNASLNLASHLDRIEAPSLLGITIAILLDLQTQDAVMTKLLPALGKDVDLPSWRAAISYRPEYNADEFARLMRGEWNSTSQFFILPILCSPQYEDRPEDYEALIRAYTAKFDFLCKALAGQKPRILLYLPPTPFPDKLSPGSWELLRLLQIGAGKWGYGYARAASIRAGNLAALDLLILEKSGTVLTADTVSKVNPEPLSEEAFLYDPATRTISLPASIAEEEDVKPVTLPW